MTRTRPSTAEVWLELEKQIFGVLGMVTPACESRTVGVVIVTRNHTVYIGTGLDTWKARHIQKNPHVSMTVPIHKSIPLMPWIKIPAATITFSGTAAILARDECPADVWQAVYRSADESEPGLSDLCMIAITPQGHFLTYGVGVSLMTMRHPEQARARVPVDTAVAAPAKI